MQLKQLIKSKCPTVPINNNTFLFLLLYCLLFFQVSHFISGTLGHWDIKMKYLHLSNPKWGGLAQLNRNPKIAVLAQRHRNQYP